MLTLQAETLLGVLIAALVVTFALLMVSVLARMPRLEHIALAMAIGAGVAGIALSLAFIAAGGPVIVMTW